MPPLYIICLVSVRSLYSSSCYFCFHPSPFLHKAILMNSILFSLAKNKWPQQFYLLIWNVVYFAFLLQQSFPSLNLTQARSFRDEAGRGDHGWGLSLGRGLGRAQPRLRRCDHSGGVRVCSSLNRGWPGGGSKKPIASPTPTPKDFFYRRPKRKYSFFHPPIPRNIACPPKISNSLLIYQRLPILMTIDNILLCMPCFADAEKRRTLDQFLHCTSLWHLASLLSAGVRGS